MDRLWAPWRLAYVSDTYPKEPGCFLCNAWRAQGREAEYLVLGRGQLAFVMMNRFPYNNGHLLVAPVRHVGEMEQATLEEAAELWRLTAACKEIVTSALHADGSNIGLNQGRAAGAGVLDHLHIHVVPRWEGDTNFMPVLGEAKVMPQALADCYAQLRPGFAARGL
jgi:ATP adenylyltransferase